MNKVILIGNLTKDPELKQTPSGLSVCTFTLAVSRRLSAEQKQAAAQDVDFIPVVVWRQLAENCAKYLAKGKKACVCGQMQVRRYQDATGAPRYITEVTANEVEFLSPSGTSVDGPGAPVQNVQPIASDELLPF